MIFVPDTVYLLPQLRVVGLLAQDLMISEGTGPADSVEKH
jgi:hypothetical protein